jgi:AcrR family transcriptional regulator
VATVAAARTQEERSESARRAIRQAALELFGINGYEATSLSMISLRAGYSRALAQYHYPDKAALARELLQERISRDIHLDLLQCGPATTPPEAWAMLRNHLALVADYYSNLHGAAAQSDTLRGEMALHQAALLAGDEGLRLKVGALTAELVKRIEAILTCCRDGHLIRPEVEPHAAAVLHVHSIWGLAQALFANPKGVRQVRLAFDQLGLLLEGMLVDRTEGAS